MKKLISLMLSCIMLLSLAFVMPVYADNITFDAINVLAGGQNIGFYDNSGEIADGDGMPEISGNSGIYLRANEWVKYDIKELGISSGTYELFVNMKTNGSERQRIFIDVFVDDLRASKTEAGIRVNTYKELSLGKIYVDENSESIKISNSCLYDNFYIDIQSVTLTYVSDDDSTLEDYDLYFHAHNIKSLEMAPDSSSDGGYWDAGGFQLPAGQVIENLSYTQNAGDWAKYDISGLKPGTYTIYLEACASANPNMSMWIDGNVVFLDRTFTSTGSYSVPREDEICMIYLDGTEQELKLSTQTAAVFVRGIRFSYESEENLTLATSQRIEAEAPVPGGQNEAYYDNGTIATRLDVLEINAGATGSTICHRTDEWVKYSINNLLPGRYALTLSSASIVDVNLRVEIDDTIVINEYTLPKQTSYSDYQTNRIGYINIESSDEIIMKVSHVGGGVATYIDYFELNRVEPFETEGIRTNLAEDGTIHRGADVLIVKTNNIVNSQTYKNAKLKDADGNILNAEISLGEGNKEIIISLKETLNYSCDYEVDLSSVTDDFDQNLEDAYVYFTTLNEDSDEGNATLDSVFITKEENKTIYKGKVLASGGLGIKGREVLLNGTYPDGDAIEEKKTLTDENGEYEFVVDYEDATQSGAYTYIITSDYVKTAKTFTDTFYTEEANEAICKEISGIKTWEEIKDILIKYEDALGINAEGTGLGLDMKYIYEGFVNREFINASQIRDEFNRYVVTEKINQAVDVALLSDIITNREEGSILGLDYTVWDLLSDANKETVQTNIFEAERISSPDDMEEFLDDVLKNALKEQFALDSAAINATFPTVKEGNGGVVKIRFAQKTENVTAIHLELSYEDGAIFDNEPFSISVKVKNAKRTVKREDNKIIIDITRGYTLDDIKEICEVTFTTLSGQEGSYPLTISGYASFNLQSDNEVIGNSDIDFPSDITGEFNVTKQKESEKNEYTPSSGGNGGGSSRYPSIPIITEKEKEPTVPETDNKPVVPADIFSDIVEAEWARNSIEILAQMGVISGRGDGTFAPNESVTRAEFLKILLGVHKIEAKGSVNFLDVKETDWFYPYVAKASELGIVYGDDKGHFNPNSEITRQDMAVISYRLLSEIKEVKKVEPSFADAYEISDYAKEAVGSLHAMGMINGVGNGMFAPEMSVTRAMASQFAYNMLYPSEPKEDIIPSVSSKEEVGERKMSATLNGDKLAVKTSYDETQNLIQQFTGFTSDNIAENGVINFSNADLTDKNEVDIFAGGKNLSQSTDEATPFLINTSYIGANHGQSSGILVKGAHNKTYADIGSVWKDDSGVKFTLLKIEEDGNLLFISDNVGTSKTNFAFVNEIKGNLQYVSDGVNKDDIIVTSFTAYKQIFPAMKINERNAYALVDEVGYKLTDGINADCDYVDIVEKYDIINPATIGEALRRNKPEGGYTQNPSLAVGETLIAYNMTYRITPDGTVMSIFNHQISGDINFRSYGAIQSILRNDVYGGGVHLYLPGVGSFTGENGEEYNFSKPTDITNGDIPNVTISSIYWDKEESVPNRTVSYLKDANGENVVAFAGGYLPVFDADPQKRLEMTNASIMLYKTKKLYPYFATSKAFEKTGTKNQYLKGAAYRKYADMLENLSQLGEAYTVPFENDMYIYIDYQTKGSDTINLPENLVKKNIELVEKSDNINYEIQDGVIRINVTNEKEYGYIVFKVSGGGYGTNTYSQTAYSDKFITE